jgi:hypothetical protein
MGILLFAAFFWVAPIFVGHKIGAPKNRAGWAWGLLLGWLGVIILACLCPVGQKTEHQSFRLSSAPANTTPAIPAPTIPPLQQPPAGWYPDPQAAGQVRYWDGAAWTTYSSPVDAPGAATPAQ